MKIKIGGQLFSVVYDPDLHRNVGAPGHCDPMKGIIRVDDNLVGGARRHVLLHEVLEALNDERNIGLEDHQIDLLAGGLAAAGVDNGWCWPFGQWGADSMTLYDEDDRTVGTVWDMGDGEYGAQIAVYVGEDLDHWDELDLGSGCSRESALAALLYAVLSKECGDEI